MTSLGELPLPRCKTPSGVWGVARDGGFDDASSLRRSSLKAACNRHPEGTRQPRRPCARPKSKGQQDFCSLPAARVTREMGESHPIQLQRLLPRRGRMLIPSVSHRHCVGQNHESKHPPPHPPRQELECDESPSRRQTVPPRKIYPSSEFPFSSVFFITSVPSRWVGLWMNWSRGWVCFPARPFLPLLTERSGISLTDCAIGGLNHEN